LQAPLESKRNRSIEVRNLRTDPAALWRRLKPYGIDIPGKSGAYPYY
jgi:hypothetical protein